MTWSLGNSSTNGIVVIGSDSQAGELACFPSRLAVAGMVGSETFLEMSLGRPGRPDIEGRHPLTTA
jgi:hypothetical protein